MDGHSCPEPEGLGASTCSDGLPPRVHDYIEDFPHENGRYEHQCVECNSIFIGHKRRRTCKVCGDANQEAWDALSEDEQQKRYAEIKGYMENQNAKNSRPASNPNDQSNEL